MDKENFILAFQIDNDELLDGLIDYHKNNHEHHHGHEYEHASDAGQGYDVDTVLICM